MAEIEKNYDLILAILQKDDFDETSAELAHNGIFMTRLSSSGGFLRKENVTIMIGVEHERREEVMEILKRTAGRRQKMTYGMPSPSPDMYRVGTAAPPVQVTGGGVTVFTMKLEGFTKL